MSAGSSSLDSFQSSHRLGVFLSQGNAISVAYSTDHILDEIKRARTYKGDTQIDDYHSISYLLTLRHETNHFTNFICSPYLTFFDDLNDYYMSSLNHTLQRTSEEIPHGALSQTVKSLAARGRLKPATIERYKRAEFSRQTQYEMLFGCPRIGDLVHRLNQGCHMIATSRGMNPSKLARIGTRLDPNQRVSRHGWTVLNILEALARSSELALLDGFGVSDTGVDHWLMENLLAPGLEDYAAIYSTLNPLFGPDIMTTMLLCSLGGSFFPFTHSNGFFPHKKRQILIEDIHPVMLLERFLGDYAPPQQPSIGEGCIHLYKSLRKRFDLVASGDPFDRNRASLDRDFHKAFPRETLSFQYTTYLKELSRQAELRRLYLKAESEDIVSVFHNAIISPDRFFSTDKVFSTNDQALNTLYEANQGPLLAFDRRLYMTAIGEYLVFGDRILLHEVETLIGIIENSYPIKYPEFEVAEFARTAFNLTAIPTV